MTWKPEEEMGPPRLYSLTLWVRRLLVANLLVFLIQKTLLVDPSFLSAFGFDPLHAWERPRPFPGVQRIESERGQEARVDQQRLLNQEDEQVGDEQSSHPKCQTVQPRRAHLFLRFPGHLGISGGVSFL